MVTIESTFLANVLLAAVSVFALALTVVAVLAFRRTRDVHLVFLATAFAVFSAKGLLFSLFLFSGSFDPSQFFLASGSLDLVILALFYGFTLRR